MVESHGVVSVVVPHHGDPAVARLLVERLLEQTDDLDLIVVDDASPTPYLVHDGVRVVRRERNGGFGAAVNSGAAIANGALLLVLNSDLVVPDDFVEDLIAAAEPFQPAVVSPRVVNDGGVETFTGRDFPRIRHQAVEWLTPLARFRDTDAWHRGVGHDLRTRTADTVVDWLVGAALLIPLAQFREVGGFDERFHMNSEEIDLQRRLRDLDVPSIAVRHPTVVHTGGGSSPTPTRRIWLVESRLTYAEMWGSRRPLQAALLACTGANLVVNTARRAAGRDIAPLATARDEFRLLRGTGRNP